jgi:hypothetical protein
MVFPLGFASVACQLGPRTPPGTTPYVYSGCDNFIVDLRSRDTAAAETMWRTAQQLKTVEERLTLLDHSLDGPRGTVEDVIRCRHSGHRPDPAQEDELKLPSLGVRIKSRPLPAG